MIKIAFFIVILLYIETAYIMPSGLYFIVRGQRDTALSQQHKNYFIIQRAKKKGPPERSPKNPRLETMESGTPT
jgi:hypothetical protein